MTVQGTAHQGTHDRAIGTSGRTSEVTRLYRGTHQGAHHRAGVGEQRQAAAGGHAQEAGDRSRGVVILVRHGDQIALDHVYSPKAVGEAIHVAAGEPQLAGEGGAAEGGLEEGDLLHSSGATRHLAHTATPPSQTAHTRRGPCYTFLGPDATPHCTTTAHGTDGSCHALHAPAYGQRTAHRTRSRIARTRTRPKRPGTHSPRVAHSKDPVTHPLASSRKKGVGKPAYSANGGWEASIPPPP